MKWEDVTSYSKNDKEKIPRILEMNLKGLRIVIHRIVHCEGWYLTVHGMGNIDDFNLNSEDLEAAKIKGLEITINEILRLENIKNILIENVNQLKANEEE